MQSSLFDVPPVLPTGMRYEPGFLSLAEERELIAFVQSLPLAEMDYRGFLARRRVLSYGGQYDFRSNRLQPAAAIPAALEPLRQKVAAWAGLPARAFTQALVAEYREGTPLGWHRDVPDFEDIVGVSLMGHALLRLRPWPPHEARRSDVMKLDVQPRSIYLLRGPARWQWQHSVAPARELRYSITLRTLRSGQR